MQWKVNPSFIAVPPAYPGFSPEATNSCYQLCVSVLFQHMFNTCTDANYLFPVRQRQLSYIWKLKDCYSLDIFSDYFPCYFYKSATGVYLAALPTPGGIQIAGKTPNDGSYEQHISHMQKKINDTIAKNKELYEISPPVSRINLHCDYVSYCLGVSLFWGYLILDIKYLFFTVEICSPHYSFFSLPLRSSQMSPSREPTLTTLFENCILPSIFDNPYPSSVFHYFLFLLSLCVYVRVCVNTYMFLIFVIACYS